MKDLNKSSNDANKAMKDIQKATGNTANSMADLKSTMKDTSGSLQDTSSAANEAASGIKSLATLEAGQKMMEFGGKIIDVVKNLMDLTEATKEFNSLQSKLQGSTKQNGYKQKDANKNASQVYGYTGDDMMAVNVVSNLQKMGLSQSELDKTVNASLAVWTAYGDSIPIESLTESITETAQVGKVTGNLADALNWAGMSEDAFNKKLEACSTVSEKNKLITDTLNQAYGKSKDTYDKTNKAMIDYNKSLWESQKAQAELGAALAPLNSAVNGIKSAFAEALAPVIKQIADAIQPVIQKVQEFIAQHPQLIAGITMVVAAITALIGIIGTVIVVVTTVKIALGVVAGVFGALSAPILIVIGVIAALIAIGVLLYKNWDTICAKATQLKDWVVNKWNELCTTLAPIVEFIKALVIRKWTEMKARITFVLNVIKGVVIVAWNTIKTAISTVISTIKTVVTNGWNAIKNAVKTAMAAIKNTAVNAFNNVKEKITNIVDKIKGAWEGLRNAITNNPIVATVRKVTESITGTEPGRPRAMGQRTIPYDNFPIRAHKGEMLLSARDARQYKQGKGSSPQVVITMNGTIIRENADIEKVVSALVRKINEQRIITNG